MNRILKTVNFQTDDGMRDDFDMLQESLKNPGLTPIGAAMGRSRKDKKKKQQRKPKEAVPLPYMTNRVLRNRVIKGGAKVGKIHVPKNLKIRGNKHFAKNIIPTPKLSKSDRDFCNPKKQ
jgi:hypothetical protein